MDKPIVQAARAGFLAKGLVYLIAGLLALLAAFNLGGQKAGKMDVIEFLEHQPFGKLILVVLGTGLCCYAFWRFVQSIKNPEGIGPGLKGTIKRISFFISGLLYLGLGLICIAKIFTTSGGGGNALSIVPASVKRYLFLAIGLSLAGKSFFQFIKVYRKSFLSQFNFKSMSDTNKRRFIKNMGYAGLSARGILTGIVSYFFIKAGLSIEVTAHDMKGTGNAFSFLQESPAGPWLMATVATGLACYGIYMFTMARYRSFG